MLVFTEVGQIQKYIRDLKQQGKKIGFVPTMGALHEGHLTLVVDALEENDLVVSSIFVNPTQFNDPEDLKKYPRPIEKDIKMLESVNCNILFLPEVSEVYPTDLSDFNIDLKGLDLTMEGEHRPGHFKGVVQVVHRLLDIVQPDCLYLGQKDFQQYTIIDFMLKVIKSNIKLVMVPIVRESDGLAMSSRNIRLSPGGRAKAPIVYQVLQEVEHYVHFQPFPTPKEAIQLAYDLLKKYGVEAIDYFKIVDGYSLKTIDSFEDSDYAVACTVVKIDQVRLLDNIILYKK